MAERVLAFEKSPTVFGLGSPSAGAAAATAAAATSDAAERPKERRIPITVVQPALSLSAAEATPTQPTATTKLEISGGWKKQPGRDSQVRKGNNGWQAGKQAVIVICEPDSWMGWPVAIVPNSHLAIEN